MLQITTKVTSFPVQSAIRVIESSQRVQSKTVTASGDTSQLINVRTSADDNFHFFFILHLQEISAKLRATGTKE